MENSSIEIACLDKDELLLLVDLFTLVWQDDYKTRLAKNSMGI
jgi:hypothetical protein